MMVQLMVHIIIHIILLLINDYYYIIHDIYYLFYMGSSLIYFILLFLYLYLLFCFSMWCHPLIIFKSLYLLLSIIFIHYYLHYIKIHYHDKISGLLIKLYLRSLAISLCGWSLIIYI